MDSGNAINENQLGEEEMETESDTQRSIFSSVQKHAGFPADFLFGFNSDSKYQRRNFKTCMLTLELDN